MNKNFSISVVLICLMGIFYVSCDGNNKKPEHIWTEERFAEVLTEVQLAESIIRLGYQNKKDSSITSDSIFNAAFRSVKTNRVEFDTNYNYYLNYPGEMEKIYELVITNLSKQSAEISKKTN